MVALQRLSGVLNCRSEDVKDGNYKGFLKEHLEAHGLQQPEYSNERKEVVTSEVEGLSTSTAEGSVAVLQPSAPTHQADDDDDEAHLTKPRDTHTPPIPRKVAKLECADVVFYATATVVLTNQEVVSDGCEHEEHAVESAYEKLAGVFGVTAPEAGKSFRAAVLTHFDTCHYTPPSEYLYQQGDKSFCKLLLCGPFTFHDKDGSIKKKQAEQQAAMVALQRLSGVLNCRSEDVKDGNYKGFLKEHLEAHGLQQPEYSNERKEVVTSEVEGPSTSTEGSVAVLQPPAPTHQADDDDHDEAHLTEPQGTHTPPIPPSIPGSRENLDQRDEIYKLLTLFNLKPPSVIVESVRNEQNFCMKVEAILDNLTFKNKDPSTSKKDAVRKAYYVLGYALGICQSNTVSLQEATMLVKQDFSQKSLPHPKELIEGTKEPFYCSLTVISYRLVYEGQGSTEADAKLDVLQKALRALPVLFGYESLPSSSSAEETEAQINAVLRSKGQKDLALSLRRRHLCSATVLLKDYAMTSTGQSNKKGNRSDLSRRILGLLGEKTEPSCSSFRNLLDEWFRKRGLQLPVFEDTEEGQGSRTTLSLSLSCSHSDWEDSLEAACGKLIQELSERFRYLSE
ncbi:uncharacterized protein LOC143484391 [Brachyhypopomus gauderio]|uniref:uncharacterized protein LOC143484391 n=1 Tax=Brachyhypopomus gauderio TaxID=698409 RepID=UPI00404297D4